MSSSLEKFWYKPSGIVRYLLLPLNALLWLLVQTRFWLYRLSVFSGYRSKLPVIVVGNISVGGTGKTPFVIWLNNILKQHGFNPVVLSRGYGAKPPELPFHVAESSLVTECGDEPKMMSLAGCNVVIDPDRTRAAKWIEKNFPDSIIICDDGLQHYKLLRDYEVCLIDGYRKLGNRLLMPLGPLREPASRLTYCDIVVQNSGSAQNYPMMKIQPVALINLKTQQEIKLNNTSEFPFPKVTAICGIGNPIKFHQTLTDLGAEPKLFGFPDHHQYVAEDLIQLGPKPIVMTEKDAVKCVEFAQENWWYLKVSAAVDDSIKNSILDHLKSLTESTMRR